MKRLLVSLGSLFLSLTGCNKNSEPPIDNATVEWVAEALPLPQGASGLWINVIRGTGADDIWLLTNANIDKYVMRLAFHYDGTRWTNVTDLPVKARTSIFPLSKTDVWAVGLQGTAAHFDGKTWTTYKLPNVDYDLVDVFARPNNDVWVAAAGPHVTHYDGKDWTSLTPPELAETSVQELWGTDKEVLVPVNPKQPPSRMARFDGTKWSAETVGPGGITLIHGSGPTDIWALSRQNQGYHFDGTAWTKFPTLEKNPFWALSVAGPNNAFAAGENGQIIHWDGTAWKKSPSGTREQLVSIFAPKNGKALAGGSKLYRQK